MLYYSVSHASASRVPRSWHAVMASATFGKATEAQRLCQQISSPQQTRYLRFFVSQGVVRASGPDASRLKNLDSAIFSGGSNHINRLGSGSAFVLGA